MWDVDASRLPMWIIYQNPKDLPVQTLARLWYTLPDPVPTQTIIIGSLQTLRSAVSSHGYTNMGRAAADDPCIVEVWV